MATTRKKPVRWLIAQQTVTVDTSGGRRWPLLAGVTRVPSDHPAAKARPDAFRDDDDVEAT